MRAERRLPHVGELIEDIRDLGLIGIVVHKDNDTLLGEDELGEGWPVVQTHGDIWWLVKIWTQSAVLEGCSVVTYFHVVGVYDQEGDYIVGIRFDPCRDGFELALIGAGVQEGTGRVATVDCVVDIVRFALDHADTVVQLGCDVVFLVTESVASNIESGIVSTHFGDVAVLSVTEFGIIVACLGVDCRG